MTVILYGAPTYPRARLEAALTRLHAKHQDLRIVSAFRLGAEQLVGIWAAAHGVPIEYRALCAPQADAAVSFGDEEWAGRAEAAGLPVWRVA